MEPTLGAKVMRWWKIAEAMETKNLQTETVMLMSIYQKQVYRWQPQVYDINNFIAKTQHTWLSRDKHSMWRYFSATVWMFFDCCIFYAYLFSIYLAILHRVYFHAYVWTVGAAFCAKMDDDSRFPGTAVLPGCCEMRGKCVKVVVKCTPL